MTNPWTRKNPFLSMWLSASNQAIGAAQGTAQAAARRQIATAQSDAMRQMFEFWNPAAGTTRSKTRRR